MPTRLLQDILNEPDELTRSLNATLGPGLEALAAAAEQVNQATNVVLTGIGSSWHAGMAVSALFAAGGRFVPLYDASELLHFARLPAETTLILLSRSGRSIEVVELLAKAQFAGAAVIGITNSPDSPLGQQADVILPLNAAFDHNVSVTMYSGLALTGGLLAERALGEPSAKSPLLSISGEEKVRAALGGALAGAKAALETWQEQIAASDWFAPDAPTYFLARGASLASGHEARLLWEEAAKAPASALTTGGFRHGPQEMLTPGTRLGLWIDGERLRSEDLTLAADLRRQGAKTLLIGQNLPTDAGDLVLNLPSIPTHWQFLIDIIPAQLAAEHLARLRGVDCDSFRLCPYIIEREGGL